MRAPASPAAPATTAAVSPAPAAASRPAPRPAATAAAAPATTGAAARATTLARPSPAPAVAQAQTYTVQSGDTLSVIAGKVYGDPNAWRRIYDANKGLLPDPGSVRPQQVLVIPR
ncbi:MAG: LysM peptidoglycan-binding domain-containing protein [Lentisphaerae bacterium]|nr:LysM peptidoglycan-binding domain-containing protein [Lentisphaerota bacterium]